MLISHDKISNLWKSNFIVNDHKDHQNNKPQWLHVSLSVCVYANIQ